MTGGAAAFLPQTTQHRIAWAVQVDDWHNFLDPLGADPFGLNPLQRIGMGGALVATDLVLGLRQHDDTTGAEHHVVVQILAHSLIKTTRFFIDRRRRILQIVRADDGGIASGVAAAQPTLFDNRDIGDAEILAKVIGGGQTMAASAHDDHIVVAFGGRRAPGALPSGMIAQGFSRDSKGRIAFHGRIRWFETVHRYASEHSASGAVYRRIFVLLRHAANRALAGQERAAGQLGLFSCALHL